MLRLVSIFLLLAQLLHISGSVMVLAGYKLNKSYITKNLCENRFVPEKKCQGSCHLKKELSKQQENESKKESRETEVFQINYVSEDFSLLDKVSFAGVLFLFPEKETPKPEHMYLPVWVPPPCV